MSDLQDLAEALFGSKRLEDSQDDSAETKTVTATALASSDGGTVTVAMSGFGDSASIEVPTTVNVREGDTVQVTLTGDTVQSPVVTGVVGGGDRTKQAVDKAQATADTATANIKLLSNSITSLVKGETTYTAPDGKTVTNGLASKITQTKTEVDTEFKSYTKTADLANTAAVRDAKKAGTDAAATANATATMIRQYAGGVLVGKTGATVGSLVNANGSFDVVQIAWSNGTPSVKSTYAQFKSVNGNTYMYGSQNIMISSGTQDNPKNVYMTVPPASDGTESDMGMGLRCESKDSVHAYMSTTDGFGDVSDWVVANGTSGVWTWRKWASGVAECWYHVGFDSGDFSWWNDKSYLRYAANAIPVYDYPFAFTDTPAVLQSVFNNDSLFVVPYRDLANDFRTKSVSGWVTAVAGTMAGSKHVELGYHAIGRWK